MSNYSGSKVPANNDEDNTLFKKIAKILYDAFPGSGNAYPSGGGGGSSAPVYTATGRGISVNSTTVTEVSPASAAGHIVSVVNLDTLLSIIVNVADDPSSTEGITVPPGGLWESPCCHHQRVAVIVQPGGANVNISVTEYVLDT